LDSEHIRDIFSKFGPVTVRRMFGGAGIYADGVMFALVADDVIYLKAGEQNTPAFEREGLAPFSYEAKGKRTVMSYRKMPDRLYDDPDELSKWAAAALAEARRASAKTRIKPPRSRRRAR
jgi:DNA transformation protein and related proteins